MVTTRRLVLEDVVWGDVKCAGEGVTGLRARRGLPQTRLSGVGAPVVITKRGPLGTAVC